MSASVSCSDRESMMELVFNGDLLDDVKSPGTPFSYASSCGSPVGGGGGHNPIKKERHISANTVTAFGGDGFDHVFGVSSDKMDQLLLSEKHGLQESLVTVDDGLHRHSSSQQQQQQQQQPWNGAGSGGNGDGSYGITDTTNSFDVNWTDGGTSLNNMDNMPSYLMAGSMNSPMPVLSYGGGLEMVSSDGLIKQEFYLPLGLENNGNNVDLMTVKPSPRRSQTTRQKLLPFAHPQEYYPSRPLVERQKRHSDDDNESVSSMASDTATDATDDASSIHSNAGAVNPVGIGLPALPRIQTVSLSDPAKRQRRDVSMSAPAVAARELRQKKKVREEHLIGECEALKAETDALEQATSGALQELKKLREDAGYLRSLVKSQQSTVALLEYLRKAPFFQEDALHLDSRSMLRQISGENDKKEPGTAVNNKDQAPPKNDVGGVCLHINGSKITLHLCSHCSSAI